MYFKILQKCGLDGQLDSEYEPTFTAHCFRLCYANYWNWLSHINFFRIFFKHFSMNYAACWYATCWFMIPNLLQNYMLNLRFYCCCLIFFFAISRANPSPYLLPVNHLQKGLAMVCLPSIIQKQKKIYHSKFYLEWEDSVL